jgi:two-component system, cell cycle sensor histidine kinase and response regulator CckA
MGKPLCILLVEDSVADAELLHHELTRSGYDVTCERVETAEAMMTALERGGWDLILSDYSMPTFSAPAALAVLQKQNIDLPFIIVSGTIGEETAVSALRAGANDFLTKDRLARLAPAIERELRDAAERRERLKLQEQLRHAQKMEAIGQLAGEVAHDFNNVLTAILGYTELMVEQVTSDQPMGQDLREVRNAALRGAALTRQLLAFSRKHALAMKAVDLSEVARDVEPMLRRLLGAPIRVQLDLSHDLNLVEADAAQLEHLLINLSVNARDAMPNGGTLSIRTSNVDLDDRYVASHPGSRAGSYALLGVSDTGVGMGPEVLTRIFDPFFTTKEQGRGTGLGLAAVYGTVKQLEGYIDVASQPGQGSAFSIYLPKTNRKKEIPPATERLEPTAGSETILIVDDDEGVRGFVRTALERSGYRVLEADSAETAAIVAAAEPGPIHLLLTDIVLAGSPGPVLASRLKGARPGMRVLLMSGYADDCLQNMSRTLEEAHWIEKPFSTQKLLTTLRQLLGREAVRS